MLCTDDGWQQRNSYPTVYSITNRINTHSWTDALQENQALRRYRDLWKKRFMMICIWIVVGFKFCVRGVFLASQSLNTFRMNFKVISMKRIYAFLVMLYSWQLFFFIDSHELELSLAAHPTQEIECWSCDYYFFRFKSVLCFACRFIEPHAQCVSTEKYSC